ncbi:MAG: PEGA domain-containing protein [Deltaproteobacteria bacterium]|nr:PEGA domain-containing protein [Deltaproteobacteria bacterium]
MSRELTRLWLFRGSLSLGIVGILAGGGAFAAPVDHPASAPSSPGSAMVMITGATASVGSSGATSSAMITINGKAVGRIPTSLRLQAGRYFVEVTRPGYKTWRHWLDVKAATPTTLRVKMAAAISKPTTGALLVAADILVSEVFVDGKSVGKVPALVANLSPGAHRIEVRAQGYAHV